MLLFAGDDPPLAYERDANDFISAAWEAKADWAAIQTARLTPDFWRLSTRLAGEVIQKFVNYQVGLAIVGDISAEVAASGALRNFVYESNKGPSVWFVADMAELQRKLASS